MSRRDDLVRFYGLLRELEDRLGGARRLIDCDGRMGWPDRGVYFFFEPGETRTSSGEGPRVVRVGTHALKAGSKSTLWNRLAQHRGPRAGAGNHRGSIFRSLVGRALLEREGRRCPSWGLGSSGGAAARKLGMGRAALKEAEVQLEEEVSSYIGNLTLLWLRICDEPGPESRRGFIERNSIALLGNHAAEGCDPASPDWLGRSSDRPGVRRSGLWNQNHVDEGYDSGFLDWLGELVGAPDERH